MLKEELHLTQKRPTMLGHPKYRHKEEKKKMVKMSYKKLQKMDDPESLLCKAVLINNTLKYLQKSSAQIDVKCNNESEKLSENINSNEHRRTSKSDSSSSCMTDIMSEITFPPPIEQW